MPYSYENLQRLLARLCLFVNGARHIDSIIIKPLWSIDNHPHLSALQHALVKDIQACIMGMRKQPQVIISVFNYRAAWSKNSGSERISILLANDVRINLPVSLLGKSRFICCCVLGQDKNGFPLSSYVGLSELLESPRDAQPDFFYLLYRLYRLVHPDLFLLSVQSGEGEQGYLLASPCPFALDVTAAVMLECPPDALPWLRWIHKEHYLIPQIPVPSNLPRWPQISVERVPWYQTPSWRRWLWQRYMEGCRRVVRLTWWIPAKLWKRVVRVWRNLG